MMGPILIIIDENYGKDQVWIGLVAFYNISTSLGYLMPNPHYTYALYIWFDSEYFIGNIIFKRAWADFYVHSYLVSSIIIKH